MSQTPSPLGLDCALRHYLEETSSHGTGSEAEFSAVMLADLGFFEKHQNAPNVSNLQALLQVFGTGGGRQALSEMSDRCKACGASPECPISRIILGK